MKYYRTPQQISVLTREIPLFEHRMQITRFVPTKHRGLREIGTLLSMRRGVLKLRHDGESHEITASDAVRYFLVTGGPLEDASAKGAEIRVFGRMERGELVDAVAIDMGNVPDPEKKAG